MSQLVSDRGLGALVKVDSAGTHVFKAGQRPDKRAQRTVEKRGINIKNCKARLVTTDDFYRFDYLCAMDLENIQSLKAICPGEQMHKLSLIMQYASGRGVETVPDPYYGNLAGFERVIELLDEACNGLLDAVRSRAGLDASNA